MSSISPKTIFNDNVVGISGSTASWLGVITASQEQLEWWLKCASYAGAFTVSVFTVFYMIRRNNTK